MIILFSKISVAGNIHNECHQLFRINLGNNYNVPYCSLLFVPHRSDMDNNKIKEMKMRKL